MEADIIQDVNTLVKTLKGHSEPVYSVAISPDCWYIVSGGKDKTICVWDLETGKLLRTMTNNLGMVYSVSVAPSNKHILSGDSNGTVHLWDLSSGELLRTFVGHSKGVYKVIASVDMKFIISGSEDTTVRFWRIDDRDIYSAFEGHTGPVYSVAVSPNNKYIVSGSGDSTVRLWDFRKGVLLKILKGHKKEVFGVFISSDSKLIYSYGSDHQVCIWDLRKGKLVQKIKIPIRTITSLAFSSDYKNVVSGFINGSVQIWELETATLLQKLEGHSGTVYSIAISPNHRYIITAGHDNSVNIWMSIVAKKKQLRYYVWDEGSLSVMDLVNTLNLDKSIVLRLIHEIPDIKLSADDIVYSVQDLKNRITQKLEKSDQLDVESVANSLSLSVIDLLEICSHDPSFHLHADRYLVTKQWLASQLDEQLRKTGYIHYGHFIGSMQVRGVTKSLFKDLLVRGDFHGIYPDDWEFFLSAEFIRDQIREVTEIFADVEFRRLAESLKIPPKYLIEIISLAIKKRIIVGKIDRVNQRVFIREVPLSLADKMINGQPATIEQITKNYNQPLEQCLRILRNQLPSQMSVLTRQDNILRVEPIFFSCQLCGTRSQDEKFLQCFKCKRDLCWDHFEELSSIGRPICPYCDGSMILLPQRCEKCNIDFIHITKNKDKCDFCGYILEVGPHLIYFKNRVMIIQKAPVITRNSISTAKKK